MVSNERRNFIAFMGALTLFPKLVFGKTEKKVGPERETALALVRPKKKGPQRKLLAISATGDKWKLYDLPDINVRTIDDMHSIETHPLDPALLAIFPRKAKIALLFSLKEEKPVLLINSKPGYHFTGHSFFLPETDQILASEVKDGSDEGFISVRNLAKGEIVDEIITGGHQPHQIIAMDAQREVLAIAHYGLEFGFKPKDLQSEIVFLNRKTKTVLQRTKKTTHLNAELCHIVANPNKPGEIFISALDHLLVPDEAQKNHELFRQFSKYSPTPLYSANLNSSDLQELDSDGQSDHLLFNFSIAISGKNKTFGVAHQEGNRVSFWNTETKKLKKMLNFPGFLLSAINSTPTGDEFFLSLSGEKSKIIYLNAKTLEITKELNLPDAGTFDAHMAWTQFQL